MEKIRTFRCPDETYDAALSRARSEGLKLGSLIRSWVGIYAAGLEVAEDFGPVTVPDDPPAPKPRKSPAATVAPDVPRPVTKRCAHPGTRVIGGYCNQCQALVATGGEIVRQD